MFAVEDIEDVLARLYTHGAGTARPGRDGVGAGRPGRVVAVCRACMGGAGYRGEMPSGTVMSGSGPDATVTPLAGPAVLVRAGGAQALLTASG